MTKQATKVTALGEVREVPLGEVRGYAGNPRKIPAKAIEQTAKSIRDFGWQQPLVVDEAGVLIVGHTRLLAAASLGLETVPVVSAKLSEEQARAYRIADNRAGDYTSWDYSKLIEELEGLDAFADTLDLTDWAALLGDFEAQGGTGLHAMPEAATDVILTGTGYDVTVEFSSQETADSAGPALLAIPGVINVRRKPNVGNPSK